MKRISLTALVVFVLIFVFMFAVHAQSPQQTLNQYINDLQKNPNDYALREKIIKHVQTMKPKPVMSTEAEKYEGRAEYAIKNAKNEADFLDAAKEYDKALLLAPWVSSYYFNQAIAYEKAGKPKEAKQSFEFYLLAAPDAQDAREVRKRIAGLEYAMEKASSPEATAERKKKEGVANDGRFCKYDNGTVLDTRTGLMWAAKDNGYSINWDDAKRYCENYRGGDYTDWRMPSQDELAGLYDSSNPKQVACSPDKIYLTNLIDLSCVNLWASETNGSDGRACNLSFSGFTDGRRCVWLYKPLGYWNRALPVRFGK